MKQRTLTLTILMLLLAVLCAVGSLTEAEPLHGIYDVREEQPRYIAPWRAETDACVSMALGTGSWEVSL